MLSPVRRPPDEPTADSTASAALQRALTGAVVLGGGQVGAQLVHVVGMIGLARLLEPAEFGAFTILAFFVMLIVPLADAGLGTSLVRRHGEPPTAERDAVFSAALVLAAVVGAAFWLGAPWIAAAYDLGSPGWLRLAVVPIALNALRLPSYVDLERRLAFDRLATFLYSSAIFQSIPGITTGVTNLTFGQGGGQRLHPGQGLGRQGRGMIQPCARMGAGERNRARARRTRRIMTSVR